MFVEFVARGVPIPQGSKTIMKSKRSEKSWLVDNNAKKLRTWRECVANAGVNAMQGRDPLRNVKVIMVFNVGERPKSYFTSKGKPSSKWRMYPNKKPDVDKLIRAVLDSLTGVCFADDAEVVQVCALKRFGNPGVWIKIQEVQPGEIPY